jgi:endonuclease/exonuclease/phosphatase (EEP) superfamily protein YafD
VLLKLVLSLGIVFGVLLSLLTFASLLNAFYWLFDVLTHFTFHYALGLVVCLVVVVVLRSSLVFPVVFVLALLVNVSLLLPFFWPRPSGQFTGEVLRVMSLNVLADNQNYRLITTYLREANADVVFLSEIEPALLTTLRQDLGDLYPYLLDESMEGTHGLAFISKQPLTTTETVALDERHHRFLTAELLWQGESVKLYGAHPHPPLSPFWTKSRDDELGVIRGVLSQEAKAHLFLGDFNASPWSHPMRQLVRDTRLRHAALGFGMYPTWRYRSMMVAAPLDHILVSAEWQVRSYALGSQVGSDHFPVVAEVYLP